MLTQKDQLIQQDGDILGGTPVFTGTRVPIRTLLDYLEAGQCLDEFLDDFPSVRREQATALIASLQQSNHEDTNSTKNRQD